MIREKKTAGDPIPIITQHKLASAWSHVSQDLIHQAQTLAMETADGPEADAFPVWVPIHDDEIKDWDPVVRADVKHLATLLHQTAGGSRRTIPVWARVSFPGYQDSLGWQRGTEGIPQVSAPRWILRCVLEPGAGTEVHFLHHDQGVVTAPSCSGRVTLHHGLYFRHPTPLTHSPFRSHFGVSLFLWLK